MDAEEELPETQPAPRTSHIPTDILAQIESLKAALDQHQGLNLGQVDDVHRTSRGLSQILGPGFQPPNQLQQLGPGQAQLHSHQTRPPTHYDTHQPSI